MASQGVSGIGAKVRRLTGSVWADLAEITKIAGPDNKRDTVDLTSLDSVGGYKEFAAGLRDAGEIKLEAIFRRDAYELVMADFDSDDLVNYEIMFPDPENTTVSFSGLVSACSVDAPMDKAITYSFSIKVSGKPTLQSGSGST
jgi:predicted secreted protein